MFLSILCPSKTLFYFPKYRHTLKLEVMATNVSDEVKINTFVSSFVRHCLLIYGLLFSCSVLLVSRVGSGSPVRKRKGPSHTPGEIKASEATIYSQKVLINASKRSHDASVPTSTCTYTKH